MTTPFLPGHTYKVTAHNRLPILYLEAETAACALALAGPTYAVAVPVPDADVPPWSLGWRDYSESECQVAFPSDYAPCDTCQTVTHLDYLSGGDWRECQGCVDDRYREGMASAQAWERETERVREMADSYASLKPCARAYVDSLGLYVDPCERMRAR